MAFRVGLGPATASPTAVSGTAFAADKVVPAPTIMARPAMAAFQAARLNQQAFKPGSPMYARPAEPDQEQFETGIFRGGIKALGGRETSRA